MGIAWIRFLAALLAGAVLGYAASRLDVWPCEAVRAIKGKVCQETADRMPASSPSPDLSFKLDDTNSELMTGLNELENERWMDIGANNYSSDFVRNFSYWDPAKRRPRVRVWYAKSGPTFRGRFEAQGLKPNFAYQLKLRGDYDSDPASFEVIGYEGRWRLPRRFTNYTDAEYEAYPDKARVEAFILFDFFVTDKEGRAVKTFELNSTLHVLFNAYYQGLGQEWDSGILRVVVAASDPAVYAQPKETRQSCFIWAQAETTSGRKGIGQVRLPARTYSAKLVLTEESFHAYGDGGFWATVMELPVNFEIK